VFKVLGEEIVLLLELDSESIFSEVAMNDLKLIDTSSYPQQEYSEKEQKLTD
jgi:hypothetical protein